MPRAALFTVIAYDIADDRRRRRVVAILEDVAARVQESVFEAWLTEPARAALIHRLEAGLVPGDSLRVYVLGALGLAQSHAFGGPRLVDGAGYLVV